jgi:hypothetical protein
MRFFILATGLADQSAWTAKYQAEMMNVTCDRGGEGRSRTGFIFQKFHLRSVEAGDDTARISSHPLGGKLPILKARDGSPSPEWPPAGAKNGAIRC